LKEASGCEHAKDIVDLLRYDEEYRWWNHTKVG
jgi:hypothetical protein